MSDQLSKVVPCQVCGESEPFSGACGSSDPRALCKSGRIESAAAPVEVEEVADDLNALEQLEADVDLVAACTGRVRSHIATLARQLAEAKEDEGQREYDREILSSLERLLRRNQFGYTGRYDEIVAQMVAALAAANAELVNLRAANIAYAGEVANLYGRAGLAESQLAEATRRLGEVEGLVNDALALQQKHYGDGMDTHMALADWARNAKAAIDARLASDSEGGE